MKLAATSTRDWVYLALVAFVLGSQVLLGLSDVLLLCFAIVGLVLWFKASYRRSTGWPMRLTIEDGWVAAGFCWVFVIKLLSSLWAQEPDQAVDNAFNHIHFLLWPGVMLCLARCRVDIRKVEPWIALSLVAMGLWYILVRLLAPASENAERFGAGVGSFGMLATSLAVLLLWLIVALTRPAEKMWTSTRAWLAVGVFFGLVALIGTQARTELGGVVVATAVIVTIRIWRHLTFARVLALAVVTSMLGVIALKGAESRFSMIDNEVSAYFSGPEQRRAAVWSSVGGRIEMYRMAIEAIRERPWFGWGAGLRPASVPQFATDPENPLPYRNFHNLFLQSVVETGVIGAFSSLAVVLMLFWFCVLKVLRDGFLEVGLLSGMLWFVYFWKSLLNATFGYNLPNAVFVLFTAWFWVMYRQERANRAT